jgi:hypothetical protein
MALDVYVMPIWKFKAGDFTSPLAKLGLSPVQVGPEGSVVRDGRDRPGWWTRWKARRETARLGREMKDKLGRAVRWNDVGDVVYSSQSGGFQSLRAYAKWLDCRDQLPSFDPPPQGNYYNHPALAMKLRKPLTFPQLVGHSCFTGYFLPVEIDRVVYVEPFRSWGHVVLHRSVGSSHRLLAELQVLAGELNADEHYRWVEGDDLHEVKQALAQLLTLAKLSCGRDLPIVFHG